MTVNKTIEGNNVTLFVSGRLDTTTAPQLEAVVDEILPTAEDLVLDFKDLEYISSAGLRVVLKAQKAMNGKKAAMKLVHVNEDIMEVFDITGFLDILTIEQ